MAKRPATFEWMLPLRDPQTPAYRWLYDSLRAGILEGRLRPGARLPATRDLAGQYHLSRGTIVNAFEELKAEGYIEGASGSGTYVSRVLPDDLLQVPSSRPDPDARPAPRRASTRKLSNYARQVDLFPEYGPGPTRAFRANLPALDLFPIDLWAQLIARRVRRAPVSLLLGSSPLGYPPLRNAIADYLGASRGVKCAPAQIMIVAGVQEAIDLAARLLLNPGDPVAMENPGYPGAAKVFLAAGAKLASVRLDNEGITLPKLRSHNPRLVYVTPGHQFPLGITMSLPRRLALLEWARKSGALIFEDDYDSEYRYSGRPVPAMQSLDRTGQVLFAGSFSKVLFPSLRLGYLVIPSDLVDRFAAAKSITSRHAPLLEQAVLCDFLVGGHFGRHLRRMREIYSQRLSALLESGQQHLTGLLDISAVEAGLQTIGWLRSGVSEASAVEAAASRNLQVAALGSYDRGRSAKAALQLGFAALEPREIRRGVRELAIALGGCLPAGRMPT